MRNKSINQHVKWAIKQGFCTQCINPWFDGLCTCGNSAKYKNKMRKIAHLAIDEDIEKRFAINEDIEKQQWIKRRAEINKTTVENPEWIEDLQSRMQESMTKHCQTSMP